MIIHVLISFLGENKNLRKGRKKGEKGKREGERWKKTERQM
jgi:hypothetical protein